MSSLQQQQQIENTIMVSMLNIGTMNMMEGDVKYIAMFNVMDMCCADCFYDFES